MDKEEPSIAQVKVFGSTCYTFVPKEKRRKFDDKSAKGIFLGYSLKSKDCKVYHPTTKKVEVTRNLIFNEGDTDLNLGKILEDVELTRVSKLLLM